MISLIVVWVALSVLFVAGWASAHRDQSRAD